jgi:uncharacterized protein YbaP (TraB family)
MLRSLRFALAALLLALFAGAAAAEPAVWVVKGRAATVVLFGSVHLLPPHLAWEPAKLKRALAEADDVWFEIPIDDAANLAAGQAALAAGLQPEGLTLSAQLTARDQARLARAAQVCGLPAEGLDRLKPWFADVTLSVASYRMAGAAVEDGVERQISASLPPTVRRRAFETPAEQIGYLSAAPVPDQVASLRQTLDELDQGPASYRRLVRAWMSGDARALRREALKPMMTEAPGVYKSLVADRNHRWVETIAERLKGSGEAVVIVGVGHLVGPDGVPALLRARGFVVEGP